MSLIIYAETTAHICLTEKPNFQNVRCSSNENVLLKRLEQNFSKELAKRYKELRQNILTKENVMGLFNRFASSIPEDTFRKEVDRWGENIPGRPISQIEEYIEYIIPVLDEKYEKFGSI